MQDEIQLLECRIHGCKLHMEASSPLTNDFVFDVRKDSKIERFLNVDKDDIVFSFTSF